jgi:hypothetical protein
VTLELHILRLAEERQRKAEAAATAAQRVASLAAIVEAAVRIRAPMYAKQIRLFGADMSRPLRATKKTRRAGATTGGVRELLARAIEYPGFRASYVTDTRINARKRAWESDTKSGFVDVLRKVAVPVKHRTLDAYDLGGVVVEVRDGDLVLNFSNGSQIELFGADSLGDHTDMRGVQKHVIWIDEAQDFPYLEEFYSAVVVGSTNDWHGECWLTGTPGRDLVGMFYEVTKEEEHERLQGWDVHIIESTDNPYFGEVIDGYYVEDNFAHDPRVSPEEQAKHRWGPYETRDEAEKQAVHVRWLNTVEHARIKNHWKGDEPDFIREQLGKWVKEDARYVYPVHGVPDHILVYAPQRLRENPIDASHPPWYDHDAAMADLPMPPVRTAAYQWLFGIGADFGYWPDPFALVVFAFCYQLPDVYEMFSWKHTKVNTDDQGRYMKELWKIPRIVSFVGDAAGKQSDFAVWQTRMNIPIEEANKRGKNELEEFLANDIRCHRVHFRGDPVTSKPRVLSPLLTECMHLVYLPTKPGKPREVHKHRRVAGVIHGDHCADGARYSYNDLRHYLAKPPPQEPEPGSREWLLAQQERELRALEDRQRRGMQ